MLTHSKSDLSAKSMLQWTEGTGGIRYFVTSSPAIAGSGGQPLYRKVRWTTPVRKFAELKTTFGKRTNDTQQHVSGMMHLRSRLMEPQP